MKSLIAALILLSAAQVFAENVTCVLTSEGKKDVVTAQFADIEDGYIYAYNGAGDMDLSITVEGYCEDNACEVAVTLDSQMLEDEAGQVVFEMTRGEGYGAVFSEPVTNAPDGKAYRLYCYYNK